jgi:hypothetical protein
VRRELEQRGQPVRGCGHGSMVRGLAGIRPRSSTGLWITRCAGRPVDRERGSVALGWPDGAARGRGGPAQ